MKKSIFISICFLLFGVGFTSGQSGNGQSISSGLVGGKRSLSFDDARLSKVLSFLAAERKRGIIDHAHRQMCADNPEDAFPYGKAEDILINGKGVIGSSSWDFISFLLEDQGLALVRLCGEINLGLLIPRPKLSGLFYVANSNAHLNESNKRVPVWNTASTNMLDALINMSPTNGARILISPSLVETNIPTTLVTNINFEENLNRVAIQLDAYCFFWPERNCYVLLDWDTAISFGIPLSLKTKGNREGDIISPFGTTNKFVKPVGSQNNRVTETNAAGRISVEEIKAKPKREENPR